MSNCPPPVRWKPTPRTVKVRGTATVSTGRCWTVWQQRCATASGARSQMGHCRMRMEAAPTSRTAILAPQRAGSSRPSRQASMIRPASRQIVVLGMMTRIPVAGVVWQTVHYLIGLERLGYEPYYVETHARTPSMLMEREEDDGSARASAFIDRVLRPFGFGDRWAFHALHDDNRCFGMSMGGLKRLYGSALALINLHGGTEPFLPELRQHERLVYLETDPVQLQVELHDNVQATLDFLEPHCAFFTFAENYGRPDCGLPVQNRFRLRPTRQPVVLDFWGGREGPRERLTTVGNWRQPWRDVYYAGESFSWSKHH